MKSIIVIPARYASTRLPQKMLLNATGKPLIQHTYESAARAKLPVSLTVACDHQAIYDAVKGFGGNVVMTSPHANSGTDRVAEVAADSDADIIVNVQGDEPEIAGTAIDKVVGLLLDNPAAAVMSTIATPITCSERLVDPACVKVVIDANSRALYFSRSMIPYPRGGVRQEQFHQTPPLFYQHLGLYAYRRDFLLQFSRMQPALLERTESLEQLRALYYGYQILVGVIDEAATGIDTSEDYQQFVERYNG